MLMSEGETFNQVFNNYKSREYMSNDILYGNMHNFKVLLFFFAANLWIQQKIIGISKHSATCKAKRAAIRKKMSHTISIVQLRRKEYIDEANEKGNKIDHEYRWVVRGHWRKQPTKKGIKVIWIDPFIKGPEDKPVKEPHRIFMVNR
jgi:hypothetical protein